MFSCDSIDVRPVQQDSDGSWAARRQRGQGRLGPLVSKRGPEGPGPAALGLAAILLPRPDIFRIIIESKYNDRSPSHLIADDTTTLNVDSDDVGTQKYQSICFLSRRLPKLFQN